MMNMMVVGIVVVIDHGLLILWNEYTAGMDMIRQQKGPDGLSLDGSLHSGSVLGDHLVGYRRLP